MADDSRGRRKRQNGTGSVFQITDSRNGNVRWVAAVQIGPRGARRVQKRVCVSREDAEAALSTMTKPVQRTEVDRFWSYVEKGPGCWLWTGAVLHGYGSFTLDGRRKCRAHRYSLELAFGRKLNPGEHALHSCDNPPCVNPAHLRPGTHRDNMADMRARGRSTAGKPRATRRGAA